MLHRLFKTLPLVALATLAVGAAMLRTDVAAPSISIAPLSLSFGPILVGALARDTVIVSNGGATNLVLGEPVLNHPDFAVGGASGGIPPGTIVGPGLSLPVEVAFRPSATGPVAATLVLSTNDPAQPEVLVPITGTGAGAPVVFVQPASLTATLSVGETAERTLTIENHGETALDWSISIQPTLGLRGLDGVTVLWDRSKGQSGTLQWSTIVGDLTAQGATVQEVFPTSGDAITPQLLSDARVYVSEDVTADWTPTERAALAAWVAAGGGVLLIGDNGISIARYNTLLSVLGATIRMSATSGTAEAVVTGARIGVHPITNGVERLWVGVGVRTLSPVDLPAVVVVRDNADRPIVGAEGVGVGRVAVMADELFNDLTIQEAGAVSADNRTLGKNAFDYLGGDLWLRPDSTSGTLAPSGSTTIRVVYDPTGLAAGEYDLAVRVSSNDPVNPVIDVPAHLTLNGFPEISATPPSISFGGVPQGLSGDQRLIVGNPGSEVLSVTSVTSSSSRFVAFPTTFSLAAGAAESLTVTFAPDSVGPFVATLTIASNAATNPSLPVLVDGTGIVNCALPCAPPALRPADVQGSDGYSFWLDVSLQSAPIAIRSFGFEVLYDSRHLVFLDSTRAEDLSDGFFVLAQQNEAGRLTCGGFGTTAIPAGSSGSLLRLKFSVACDTCAVGSTSELRIGNPIEDIAGVHPCCSVFTVAACPTGDGDVNQDSTLTATDALCALKIFLNGQEPPPDASCVAASGCEVEAADTNCDSLVTPSDALAIYERVLCVAEPTPLPCLADVDPNPCGHVLARGGPPALAWGTARRGAGGEWSVPLVAIGNAPVAFGLEIELEGAAIEAVRPAVPAEWTAFDTRVVEGGRLRVAGFRADGGGTSGELATLVVRRGGRGVLHVLDAHDVVFEGPREVVLGAPAVVDGLELAGASPASGAIAFDVGIATFGVAARLGVHDVTGRLVRALTPTPATGRQRIVWDGRDEAGRAVAAGIYFARLEVGERAFVRKVALLR